MRIVLGLLIVLIGLGWLLDAAGIGNIGAIIADWWPVALIVVGIAGWQSNRRAIFGPLLIALFGLALLATNLSWLPGNAWDYFWPGLIILAGFSLLIRRTWPPNSEGTDRGGDIFVAFSGTDRRVQNTRYSGSSITVWFGGAKLDLRNAQIDDNATLRIFCAFGGTEILLPRSVNADVSVTPILGGADNKTQPDQSASRVVRITGTVWFGGVEVKN